MSENKGWGPFNVPYENVRLTDNAKRLESMFALSPKASALIDGARVATYLEIWAKAGGHTIPDEVAPEKIFEDLARYISELETSLADRRSE